jgi:hypothetical protein
MRGSATRGEPRFSAKDRDTLEKWLKSRCQWSDNVFDDPGYSECYRNYFTWFFDDGTYIEGDIDYNLNIGYFEPVYDEGIIYDELDEKLEPYTDFVPSEMSNSAIEASVSNYPSADQERARKVLSRTGIVILPGSNHSNANYLYKRFREYLEDVREFSVPYVRGVQERYRPSHKKVTFSLSKEDIYNFAYSVSTTDHRFRKMTSLLNLDKQIGDKLADTWEGSIYTRQNLNSARNNRVIGSNAIKELELIHGSIDRLAKEIDRYYGVIQGIWYDILLPFINSDDCFTLRYLSDYDYWIFEEFMTSQSVFKVMCASMQRLREREAYLIR